MFVGKDAKEKGVYTIFDFVKFKYADISTISNQSHVPTYFNRCLNGILKNKLKILVTHQIQYLENATSIYTMKNVNKK